MKKSRVFAVAVAAAVVVVLFILRNTDGYHDYPTQVVSAEQANNTFLERLMTAAGYEGKQINAPDYNLRESTYLTRTVGAKTSTEDIRAAPPQLAQPRSEQRTNNTVVYILLGFAAFLAAISYILFYRRG
jgi:hypothetical protein